MSFIQSIIDKILGVRDYSNSENRAIRISTIMFLESIVIALVYLPFHFKLGGWELVRISWLVGGASLISIFLMKLDLTIMARLFFITFANLGIFLNSEWAGLDSCIHYFFGVSISLPFFMFATSKHRWQILYSILTSIIFGMATQFSEFSFLEKLIINQDFIVYYKSLSTISALIMLAYTTYYFHSFVEKNEKEIEQKNQMIFQSEKMVSLGILSSGIAHEINNPLTVLKMGLNQLKKQCSDVGEEKKEAIDKLNKLGANVDRIAKIVQALKTYSRNESQDPVLPVSLDLIIEESISLLTKEFSSNSIELKYFPHLTNLTILGREGELIQVFVNLIKNSVDAIKNSQDGRWIKIYTTNDDTNVFIHFVDSGKGIPEDVLEKLFEPFYSTKSVGEGTGLGLYIGLNLIEAMGGKLNYQLVNGHTAFIVSVRFAS